MRERAGRGEQGGRGGAAGAGQICFPHGRDVLGGGGGEGGATAFRTTGDMAGRDYSVAGGGRAWERGDVYLDLYPCLYLYLQYLYLSNLSIYIHQLQYLAGRPGGFPY